MQIIISAGDLTRDGTKSELEAAKKVFDNSEMKYAVTPGNHDGYKGLFYNVFTEQGFQSFKINGNKFILIDDSSYKTLNYNTKTANQKNWIVSEIEECKTITCIVVMHRPINHPTSDHIMGEDNANSAAEAKWLLKLLVNNKIKEIESGHIHRFETYTKGGMKTNLVGPGLYSDFSEFTVKSDGTIIREQIKL
jgi:predicted phosphodiesterase